MAEERRGAWVSVGVVLAAMMLGAAAIDLYLPSVPHLPRVLGGTVTQAQLTIALFMCGFAVSQLLFGALGDMVDKRRVLLFSLGAFTVASYAAMTAEDIETLMIARIAQGFAASAGAAMAPAMIRAMFDEVRSIRVMALAASIMSTVPALAPALGAWIFHTFDWRANFVLLTGGGAVLIAAAWAMPPQATALVRRGFGDTLWGYVELAGKRRYVTYVASYALGFGALLTVVAGLPYVLAAHMGAGAGAFVATQVAAIASFVVLANLSGSVAKRIGADRTILLGATLQVVGGLLMAAYTLAGGTDWVWLAATYVPVNAGLGLRGAAGFTKALDAAADMPTRAGAMLQFVSLGFAAAGSALTAPFLELGSHVLGLAVLAMTVASLAVFVAGIGHRAVAAAS